MHLDSVSAKLRDLLPLHHRAITKLLGYVALKSSGADPSPSRFEDGNGEGIACSALRVARSTGQVTRERDTVTRENTLAENVSLERNKCLLQPPP